jgi:hypothetical protein
MSHSSVSAPVSGHVCIIPSVQCMAPAVSLFKQRGESLGRSIGFSPSWLLFYGYAWECASLAVRLMRAVLWAVCCQLRCRR